MTVGSMDGVSAQLASAQAAGGITAKQAADFRNELESDPIGVLQAASTIEGQLTAVLRGLDAKAATTRQGWRAAITATQAQGRPVEQADLAALDARGRAADEATEAAADQRTKTLAVETLTHALLGELSKNPTLRPEQKLQVKRIFETELIRAAQLLEDP